MSYVLPQCSYTRHRYVTLNKNVKYVHLPMSIMIMFSPEYYNGVVPPASVPSSDVKYPSLPGKFMGKREIPQGQEQKNVSLYTIKGEPVA